MLRRAVHGAAAAAAAAVGGFASTHCEPPPSPRGPRHDTQLSALDKAPRAIVLSVLDGSCALWDAAGLERRSCSALRSRLLNAVLLSGSTNPALAEEVGYESGLAVGQVAVSTFADGEVGVKILESVRGKDVFVLQSATPPINDSIMETLLIVSAARRASARSVTLISPSLPYGQDVGTVASLGHLVRHGIIADGTDGGGTVDALEGEGTTVLDGGAIAGLQAGVRLGGDDAAAVARALAAQVRAAEVAAEAAEARLAATHSALGGWGSDGAAAGEGRAATTRSAVSPIAASDVAKLFTSAGVDRLLSVDIAPPGSSQLEGFFPPHVPVESLRSARICCDALARLGLKNVTIVAPHEDVIQLATEFRTGLAERCAEGEDVGLAVIVEAGSSGRDRYGKEKPRNERVFHLIGDVAGRDIVLADLVVDTAKTLCDRVSLLKANGARRIVAVAPHALFSGAALQRINRSPLELVIVSNSIPLREQDARYTHKIMQLSVAPLIASAVVRVQANLSLSPLRTASNVSAVTVPGLQDVRYRGQE